MTTAMRGKSCVSVADAFNEITLAQISNSMGFGELKPLFFILNMCWADVEVHIQ